MDGGLNSPRPLQPERTVTRQALPRCHLSAVPSQTVNFPYTARHTLAPTLTPLTGSRHHLAAARRHPASPPTRRAPERANEPPGLICTPVRCAAPTPAAIPRNKP